MIHLSETSTALRADAARNRDGVLAAAPRVFAESESTPSMRAIAREAGVGIATLYRRFPTREALVDAVYRDQVQRLTDGAHELLQELPPAAALRRWMDLFGDWLATKHGMTDSLLAMIESGDIVLSHTRDELLAVIDDMLEAGRRAGTVRTDSRADDVNAALLGIFAVTMRTRQPEQAGRVLDLLMDGLRVQPIA